MAHVPRADASASAYNQDRISNAPDAGESTMSSANEWTDMDGTVAKRANRVVTGVLEWAAKSDVNKVKRRNIEDATKHLLPVEGEDTVSKYVERVVNAGPFSPARAPGQWWIDWSEVPEDEFSSEVPSNE